MRKANQTPEQAAREVIDEKLSQTGWFVQDKTKIDFNAGVGVAVREFQTDAGPADYAFDTQAEAIQRGKDLARKAAADLTIMGRDGKIRSKDSYGNDPLPPRDTEH